jgi:CheY-like chemotaxis protein
MSRVLIIDDEPMVRSVLSRALTGAGHAVSCVSSVREGVRAFAEGAYDVVVTDVYMPDEDGLDALRQLRQVQPDVCVVVFSGSLADSFGTTLSGVLLYLGATAALSKSGGFGPVVELVDRLTRERAAAAPPLSAANASPPDASS